MYIEFGSVSKYSAGEIKLTLKEIICKLVLSVDNSE